MELAYNNTYEGTVDYGNRFRVLLRRKPWLRKVFFLPLALRRLVLESPKHRFHHAYDRVFRHAADAVVVVGIEELGGVFELDYRSDLLRRILRTGNYEPELAQIINRYADSNRDAVDIGANVGLFTVLLSNVTSANNRVLAVEPTPNALNLLHSNLRRNQCADRVSVFEGIVAETDGEYDINYVPGMEEYTSIGEISHPSAVAKPVSRLHTEGRTLDTLVEMHDLDPGFVKIDAEGAEFSILKGSIHTLKTYKPTIFCELSSTLLASQHVTTKTVVSFLNELGYNVYDAHAPQRPISHPFEGEIIALPKE